MLACPNGTERELGVGSRVGKNTYCVDVGHGKYLAGICAEPRAGELGSHSAASREIQIAQGHYICARQAME